MYRFMHRFTYIREVFRFYEFEHDPCLLLFKGIHALISNTSYCPIYFVKSKENIVFVLKFGKLILCPRMVLLVLNLTSRSICLHP